MYRGILHSRTPRVLVCLNNVRIISLRFSALQSTQSIIPGRFFFIPYADYLISNFENDAEKDVILSKLLTKIGPVLGLIGTLIAMSPALVGLSTGDIAGMSYNMQVVFATTVVGLVISGVGLVSLQFKQRWYAKDVNNLDYVSRKLIEKNTEA